MLHSDYLNGDVYVHVMIILKRILQTLGIQGTQVSDK